MGSVVATSLRMWMHARSVCKVGIRNDDMVHPHNTSDDKIKSDEPHLTIHVPNANLYT